MKLAEKVAVITGGSTGIGLAIAKRFASEGAHVYITGRRQAELDAAVQAIGGTARKRPRRFGQPGPAAGPVRPRQGKTRQARRPGRQRRRRLAAAAGPDYRRALRRHFCAQRQRHAVHRADRPAAAGQGLVGDLTGSTAASGGTEAFSVYAASKAAVRAFARNWILDLKGRDIRVNTLSPGPIKTPGLVELVGNDAGQQQGFLDHLAP